MRLLFTLLIISTTILAQTTEDLFSKANVLYEQNEYSLALDIYSQIEESGLYSPEIYFNKANCYYKTNEIAKAILYYERALKLDPTDEDILFNLGLTQLKLVDRLAKVPQPFYKKWLFNIKSILTIDQWAKLGVMLLFVFTGFFVAFIFSNSYKLKKRSLSLSLISLVSALASLTFAYYSFNTEKEEAILMQDNAYIKSAPSEKSEDLFILHEGTKVEILETFNDWSKIKLSDGMIGWVESLSIQSI